MDQRTKLIFLRAGKLECLEMICVVKPITTIQEKKANHPLTGSNVNRKNTPTVRITQR